MCIKMVFMVVHCLTSCSITMQGMYKHLVQHNNIVTPLKHDELSSENHYIPVGVHLVLHHHFQATVMYILCYTQITHTTVALPFYI